MKRKGFTLIELLAVIVVLAIIALIATPIVMNAIKNAKKGAAERSADNYVKAVEQAVAESRIDGTKIPNGDYQITSDGNLCYDKTAECSDDEKILIEMKGTKPSSGRVVISDGAVTTRTIVSIGDYGISYDTENKKYVAQELGKEKVCTAVKTLSTFSYSTYDKKYNVITEEAQYGILASAGDPYASGVEYSCDLGDGEEKIFFVLESSKNNVSLIMAYNVGKDGKAITDLSKTSEGKSFWCNKSDYLEAGGTEEGWLTNSASAGGSEKYYYGNNILGPLTAEKNLKSFTSTWTKLISPQITLPTVEQIAKVVGFSPSVESSFNLDNAKWLYSNLRNGDSIYSYWTSSAGTKNTENVRFVYSNQISGFYAGSDSAGIRPVITVSKSQLG